MGLSQWSDIVKAFQTDPAILEKLGLAGVASTLLAMIALVVRTLIKGPTAIAAQNKSLIDTLTKSQGEIREQNERFHRERMDASQANHDALMSAVAGLASREDRQDAQLDSIRSMIRRLSMVVALQKVEPADVPKIVDAVIAGGEIPITGYERPDQPID